MIRKKLNMFFTKGLAMGLFFLGSAAFAASAQQAKNTAAQPLPLAPDALAIAQQGLLEWRLKNQPELMNDWGQKARYREANAVLPAPATGEKRVVYFGDSITDHWPLAEYFPGKPYINRGIGGQTTAQMVVRFREDVIDLKPAAVVILAGTNDIAGNTGPVTLKEIEANYMSMADLASANNIKVVFCAIMPVSNYTPQSMRFFVTRPMDQIRELNRWLKEYCASHNFGYVDYFTPTLDSNGFLRRELSEDGLHPNAAGYKLMAPLVESAIGKILQGT